MPHSRRVSVAILNIAAVLAFGAAACVNDTTAPTTTKPILSQLPTLNSLATDAFERADENPLAGNWTIAPPLPWSQSLALNANHVVPTNMGADGEAYYSAISWPADQYSRAKLYVNGTAGANQGFGLLVRQSSSAVTHYRLMVDHASNNNVGLDKAVDGTYTNLAYFTQSWTDGDIWELRVTATELQVFRNGSQVGTDVIDGSISSGSPGIAYSCYANSGAIDDWDGGSVGTGQTSNQLLTYHGGPIISNLQLVVIYWSNRTIYAGGPAPGTYGPGNADGSLLAYFLNHLAHSPYYNINSLYYTNAGEKIANNMTYRGFRADNQNVPAPGSSVSSGDIGAVAERAQGIFPANASTLYLVLTDAGVQFDVNGGNPCGFHHAAPSGPSWRYGGVRYDDRLDGCLYGRWAPNGDIAAESAINTIAHEIVETASDGDDHGWYRDGAPRGQNENADVCKPVYPQTYQSTSLNPIGHANARLGEKDFLLEGNFVNREDWAKCEAALYTIEGPPGTGLYTSTLTNAGTNTWTVEPVIPGNTFQWQYALGGTGNWQDFPSETGPTLALSRDSGGPILQALFRVVVTAAPFDTVFKTPSFPVTWIPPGSGPPQLGLDFSGPSTMGPSDVCSWHATAHGGTPPYTYDWQNGGFVQTTGGTSAFSSAGPVYITVSVSDAAGAGTGASMQASVDENTSGCN